jgi:hypothetical protein
MARIYYIPEERLGKWMEKMRNIKSLSQFLFYLESLESSMIWELCSNTN